MVELRSFQIFLILMIPFTAAVTQHRSITVRLGDEATLLCEDVKDLYDKCFSTTWIFSDSTNRPAVTLFEHGQIHRVAAAKSDRLSVTEKCSLVIKKVINEDAGFYNCRQFDESGKPSANSEVRLYVNYRDNGATPPPPSSPKTTTKRITKATKVTNRPTTTKTTAKATKATTGPPPTTTTKLPTTTKTTTKATIAVTEKKLNSGLPAILIPVAVVLAALLIIIVAFIRWKRAEGDNIQLEDNTADPPDGVFYASIHYKKKTTKSKTRVQGGDDTVTYSTLNTFSTSARASTDPRNL